MITLETLPEASEQEVFDQVVNHLREQGCQSKDDDADICTYLNDDGLQCAAGCLIARNEYTSDFENASWLDLVEGEDVPEKHSDLINELQKLHDSTSDVKKWESKFEELAHEYQLKYTPQPTNE